MSSLLPPNATAFERALEDVIALRLEALAPAIDTLRTLWTPADCPVNILPWLAWSVSVDEWESDWPEATKRSVVDGAIAIHRHKGTPWAVEQALILSGQPFARVEEWFEYGGLPGYFKVVVDIEGEAVTAEEEARLLKYVASAKRKSAWLETIEYNLATIGAVPVPALSLQSGESVTVYPQ
jgi:phage tail P2-like protein